MVGKGAKCVHLTKALIRNLFLSTPPRKGETPPQPSFQSFKSNRKYVYLICPRNNEFLRNSYQKLINGWRQKGLTIRSQMTLEANTSAWNKLGMFRREQWWRHGGGSTVAGWRVSSTWRMEQRTWVAHEGDFGSETHLDWVMREKAHLTLNSLEKMVVGDGRWRWPVMEMTEQDRTRSDTNLSFKQIWKWGKIWVSNSTDVVFIYILLRCLR